MKQKRNTVAKKSFKKVSLVFHHSVNKPNTVAELRHSSSLILRYRKKRMAHIGEIVAQAIQASGYSKKQVAENCGIGRSTLHRWLDSPNLTLSEITKIHSSNPYLNLRSVYEILEERLGEKIPENPYREKPIQADSSSTDPGISISLDTKKYAGYAIPPDLTKVVQDYIEDYQSKIKKS